LDVGSGGRKRGGGQNSGEATAHSEEGDSQRRKDAARPCSHRWGKIKKGIKGPYGIGCGVTASEKEKGRTKEVCKINDQGGRGRGVHAKSIAGGWSRGQIERRMEN